MALNETGKGTEKLDDRINKEETEGTELEGGEKTVTSESVGESDYLKFRLSKPVDYQQFHLEELDLSGMENLTGNDMNVIYDLYTSLGGSGMVMQESTLRFAQITASRATELPLELFGKLSAKDTIRLKNRIYRFFYL